MVASYLSYEVVGKVFVIGYYPGTWAVVAKESGPNVENIKKTFQVQFDKTAACGGSSTTSWS